MNDQAKDQSMEIFLSERGRFLSVPHDCGLEFADAIVVRPAEGKVFAVCGDDRLPIQFPEFSPAHIQALAAGKNIAVGEWHVGGVANAYFVSIRSE